MKERRFGLGFVAMVAAVFASMGVLGATAADGPAHAAGRDFLAKAATALKAVQEGVTDDKILGPLKKAKIEKGEGYLTIATDTAESWPNFPSKSRNLARPVRGYGRLRIDAYADFFKGPPGTPFIPPPGCHYGSTDLVVPGTSAKIMIETTTSDPGAQRRLVNLVVKELGKAGITARPSDPESVDSFPRPPAAGTPVPPITPPAGCGFSVDRTGRAAQMVPNVRQDVPVNTQASLRKTVGGGFEDWEYPRANLLPHELPGLIYVSGPTDPRSKTDWRKPVAFTQKPTGVAVAVNCYRKPAKLPPRVTTGNPMPADILTEPDYEYRATEFHGLKAATATAESREVFVFRDGDILYKIEAAQGDARSRRDAVRSAAEAIWKFRHPH